MFFSQYQNYILSYKSYATKSSDWVKPDQEVGAGKYSNEAYKNEH